MKTPRNYAEDRNRCHTLTKRAHMSKQTGGPKEDALVDKDEDPRVSQHAKDRTKRLTGGAGRHLGSATPGSDPVQVHFGEE